MRAGTDIVAVGRIRKSIGRESFLKHVYSQKEREYIFSKADPAPSAAANWAGKEAYAKALGTGVRDFELSEVEILRDTLGAPYIVLSGKAKQKAELMGVKSITVSLSHEREYAVAFVIVEEE